MNDCFRIIKKLLDGHNKCLVNADLDGLLSGMLLHQFLDYEIVGYSSCSGKNTDALWINIECKSLSDVVFIDLPVCKSDFCAIDQHFVLYDGNTYDLFNLKNKVNPNILRNRVFCDETMYGQYTKKYPFGTFHFMLAVLEHLGYISSDYIIPLTLMCIDNMFDVADLLCRADRVIGNTTTYTANCFDWANWLMSFGGNNTLQLFKLVMSELDIRKKREREVEKFLFSIECTQDGDFRRLLRQCKYSTIDNYLSSLSTMTHLKKLQMDCSLFLHQLKGNRLNVATGYPYLKNAIISNKVLSYAFVSSREISFTYWEDV